MAYPDCECNNYNHHLKMCVCEFDDAMTQVMKPRGRTAPFLTERARNWYVEHGWMSPEAPYNKLVDPQTLI